MRCCLVVSLLLLAMNLDVLGEQPVEFNRDVRAVLSDRCFQCHGPDENSREADLRLDVAGEGQGPFEDRGGYLVLQPGAPESSELWTRITSADDDLAMPPKDSHKEPLTGQQRDLIKRWIEQGAKYQPFWAFVAPKSPKPVAIDNAAWQESTIDQFVYAQLAEAGRQPKPMADKRTLIRRVTFDLTGLPPTRKEIRDFLADDSPTAYQSLVNRLIDSPRYGEHMAKYWLDLVRFADTNGIHHDHYREMTPYRDWVIRSFNENLPFDDFTKYQIAGDLYENPTIDQQIASGFNRLHLVIDVGTAIPEESFVRNVIDRVTAVGTAFMGMTVGCAVCHDHKYDPLSQKEFFELYAFFNNIDASPETPGSRVHAPFIRLPSDTQKARLADFNRQQEELTALIESLKEKQVRSEELKLSQQKLKDLNRSKQELEKAIPVSLIMKEREEVRPTHILIRGAYDQPGERVERNTPAFLPPLRTAGDRKTRMDLANWLVSPDHPLMSRVTVNRFWQQFFGVGLVRTSEDFGGQGELPSHPALLDHLATQFIESRWDVKAFVKSIVMSRTYRQSSVATAGEFNSDPQNRQLARGSRFRLDAEMIRDQILFVCGLLNEEMYGKSVKPPQPPNLWKNVSMRSSSTYAFQPDSGPKIYRRSLYSFWKRALPPPQMTIFDAPTREACTARRERTNTPLQALVLMNESQYFRAARHYAQNLLQQTNDDDDRIRIAFESITSRLPDDEELARLTDGLERFRTLYRESPDRAKKVCEGVELPAQVPHVELAAHTMLINALFNLDIVKTRQ